MKSSIFWDITSCSPSFLENMSPLYSDRNFLHAGFFFVLFFDPEVRGVVLLGNVG
jgi:hypothetical protein